MAVNANELRKGQAIQYNSDVCVVLEVTHRTPGNLRAFVQAILRSIRTGKSMDVRFSSAEKIETVPLMTYKMEFSYKSGDDYVFVNPENYEEVTVTPEFVGDSKNFLRLEGAFTHQIIGIANSASCAEFQVTKVRSDSLDTVGIRQRLGLFLIVC